jgi:D-proline reductase (dithiol) PrdB
VCHQTVSLIARVLEANGIATVIVGSALDIVRHSGVPRYLHSDLPLGNPCGAPYDKIMQQSIMNSVIQLLSEAKQPNTVARSPAVWPGDNSWRDDYSKVDANNAQQLKLKGEARRRQQSQDKTNGGGRAAMIP